MHEESSSGSPAKTYKLLGPDRKQCLSLTPGTLGGYRPKKIYGRLDCPSALRYLKLGHYAAARVFFASEEDAIANGYRPCFHCMRPMYKAWKASRTVDG